MTKAELIRTCRYYHGEDICPYATDSLRLYWDLERVYVRNGGTADAHEAAYYKIVGGKSYPGIPDGLLITMFVSYMKQSFDTKKALPFFYEFVDGYLEAASDHIPKSAIPG